MKLYKITDVLVLSQRLSIGLAATSPDVSLLYTVNHTSIPNATLPQPLHVLPPDPFPYRVPQSSQIITFSRYSRTLKREDVLVCLLDAASEVIREVNLGPGRLMDTKEIQTRSGHVILIFYPSEGLTWKKWGTSIIGINGFFNDFGFMDCDFYVEILDPPDKYGSGLLGYL